MNNNYDDELYDFDNDSFREDELWRDGDDQDFGYDSDDLPIK